MKRSVLLLLLGFFPFISLLAQKYETGNLVLVSGDTLSGMVGLGPNNTFAYRKTMKTSPQYKKLEEVAGYQMDTNIYRKFRVEVQMGNFPEHRVVFLKSLVEGPVTLYEYTGKGLLWGIHTNHFVHSIGADFPFRVPEGKRYFKQEMKNYFRDHPTLADRIKSKELGYENLVEIVREFNDWFGPVESVEEEEDSSVN